MGAPTRESNQHWTYHSTGSEELAVGPPGTPLQSPHPGRLLTMSNLLASSRSSSFRTISKKSKCLNRMGVQTVQTLPPGHPQLRVTDSLSTPSAKTESFIQVRPMSDQKEVSCLQANNSFLYRSLYPLSERATKGSITLDQVFSMSCIIDI